MCHFILPRLRAGSQEHICPHCHSKWDSLIQPCCRCFCVTRSISCVCPTAPVTQAASIAEHGLAVGRDILLCALSPHPGPTAPRHDAYSCFTHSPGGLRLPPLKEVSWEERRMDTCLISVPGRKCPPECCQQRFASLQRAPLC